MEGGPEGATWIEGVTSLAGWLGRAILKHRSTGFGIWRVPYPLFDMGDSNDRCEISKKGQKPAKLFGFEVSSTLTAHPGKHMWLGDRPIAVAPRCFH